jgi:hypothetical protein
VPAAAQEPVQPEVALASTIGPSARREHPRLVRIPDPLARRVTLAALNAAVARVEGAGCSQILLDFSDGEGRPLADRLTALGMDFDQYVGMLVFYDGSRTRTCDRGAVAFTTQGGRAIHVCVDRLKQLQQAQPEFVIAALLHEVLHTLGLGENPPSSSEITKRVLARCGRR